MGPEKKIQEALKTLLMGKGWTVKDTHGNLFQQGFPDLYAVHPEHKQRWIEVKNLSRYRFTPAQLKFFPILDKCVGLWILTSATEAEYRKLFQPSNWYHFL